MVVGYSHSHSLAHVGARLAALGLSEPTRTYATAHECIFYLVGLIVVALLSLMSWGFGEECFQQPLEGASHAATQNQT